MTRRYDPDRRARILRAALDTIAEHGVAGTTHRRIAAAADVPLGSMTYHFAGLDDLLTEAFTLLADTVSARFTERLAAAGTRAEACEAVVDLVVDDDWATPRNLLLSYELYAYAARVPALRSVMQGWMGKSRAALEQHFLARDGAGPRRDDRGPVDPPLGRSGAGGRAEVRRSSPA